jgi:hypothetical protein
MRRLELLDPVTTTSLPPTTTGVQRTVTNINLSANIGVNSSPVPTSFGRDTVAQQTTTTPPQWNYKPVDSAVNQTGGATVQVAQTGGETYKYTNEYAKLHPHSDIVGDACFGDWRYPPDCGQTLESGGRPCDYRISWSYVESTDDIEFNLETRVPSNWWTGIGFGTTQTMVLIRENA